MLIGYMRVSKADGSQSTDLQRDALRAAGIATRRLYEDRASGRLDARPGLDAALKALRRGDTLIVLEARRSGRDLRHLINVIHDLSTRNIGFKVLTGHGASIDTTTLWASWCSALIFRFRPPDCRKRTRLRRVDNRWNSWNLASPTSRIRGAKKYFRDVSR
jgi:Resolvase, N terminal domain